MLQGKNVASHCHFILKQAAFCLCVLFVILYTIPTGWPYVQSDTKKWEILKNPTKIEEIQEKKFIDRN